MKADEADATNGSTIARRRDEQTPSLQEVHGTVGVPPAKAGFWRQWMAFAGPAILISVGYMDPGNWGTDLAGGAQFKYGLLWVVGVASFMAVFLQIISARLGVATGKDLAQCCRDWYPTLDPLAQLDCHGNRRRRHATWPSHWAAPSPSTCSSASRCPGPSSSPPSTCCCCWRLQGLGMRIIEAVVAIFVATIGVCYGIEIFVLPQTHPVSWKWARLCRAATSARPACSSSPSA